MKVKEFKEFLKHAKDDEDIVIAVAGEQTIGRMAVSRVKFAYEGFDWEHGLFIIQAEDYLYRQYYAKGKK